MDSARGPSLVTAAFRALTASFTRVEAVLLPLLLVAHLALHSLLVVPEFGEPDGARMAGDAVNWHYAGVVRLDTTDYRMRTSPLYIHAMERALRFGTPIEKLPALMTRFSLVTNTLALLAAYLLFRKLAGRPAGAVATVLLAGMPGFFLAGIYGMAHGPALAMWLAGLLCFSESLEPDSSPRRFWILCALSLAFVFATFGFKADLVLNGAAFPGIAWLRGRLSRKTFFVACGIVVVGLILQMGYAKLLVVPGIDHAKDSVAGRFQHGEPFSIRFLKDKIQTGAVTHSPGVFLFAVGIFAMAAHALSKRGYRLGLVAFAWAAPPVVFWLFIMGNSARHNVSALPPVALAVGALVAEVAGSSLRVAVLGAICFVANYFSDTVGDPVGFGAYMPKSNLVELARDVAESTSQTERWASLFGKVTAEKKAVVARSSSPFAMFEAMVEGARTGTLSFQGTDFVVKRRDGKTQTVKSVYPASPTEGNAITRRLLSEGFVVHHREF
ncbi:MAG TPA: hypothetical protein VHE30_30115 [Polyangiaceae bacterium]|nr:hypothetical protein [Polyangiaceae bacterium]